MTRRMVMVIGLALLAICWTGLHPAHAQNEMNKPGTVDKNTAVDKTTPTDKIPMGGMLNASDKAFLMEAARGSQAEIELGQVAADHGGSPEVIKFGQQMNTDHGRFSNELKQLALKKDVILPQELDAKTKMLKDKLLQVAQRTGVEFDRDYMKKMVQDHEQDITLFQREVSHGKDPDVQSWAQKTLPTLQDHLRMARNINDNLKKNRTAHR